MTELQPGTRVRTAAVLSEHNWSPEQNQLRRTGTDGRIRAVHTPLDGSEPWYEVAHGATTAKYSAHELTSTRERAREVAAPTPEQERLDKLAHDVADLRRRHEGLERRYVGTLHRMTERLSRLEPEPDAHPSEPDPRADIGAARKWCELPEAHRNLQLGRLGGLLWSAEFPKDPEIIHAALEATPALLRRIEQLEQSPRRSRIQAWQALERACRAEAYEDARTESQILSALQVLDELPDDDPPPDSAPPSEAGLAQGIRDLTCAPAALSLSDALEAAGWKMEESGAAASALRVALGVPETREAQLGDLATEMIRRHRRATGQLARVRERLANLKGRDPDDEPLATTLAWIEPRVGVVRDLTEAIPVEALRGVAAGLGSFAGDDHCPAAVVSAALYELAAVEDPPDDEGPECTCPRDAHGCRVDLGCGDQTAPRELELLRRLHRAADEQMGIRACASLEDALADLLDAGYPPPAAEQELAQPVQEPS